MGMRIFEDSHCSFCRLHTDRFCDRCNKPICEDHAVFKPIHGHHKAELCPECAKKEKQDLW